MNFIKKEKKKPKQRRVKNKSGFYKCDKSRHFGKYYKSNNTIKQLKISNEEKENLIRMLEIQDIESNENESESSSSENYCSCSSNKSGPDISFDCNNTCCKTVNVLTK
jgi:hypothetical protein